MPTTYTQKFELEVGRFIAGTVERTLRSGAFSWGIDINIEKHMGWLEGIFLVTIKHEDAKRLTLFCKAVEETINDLKD